MKSLLGVECVGLVQLYHWYLILSSGDSNFFFFFFFRLMLFYHRLRFQHGKDDGEIAPCLCFCLVITLLFDIVVGYVFKILFF